MEPVAPGEPIEDSIRDKFERGEEVESCLLPYSSLTPGVRVVGARANYGGESVNFAGKVTKIEVEGNSAELIVHLSGTSSEGLLRFATGTSEPVVRAHLCPPDCDQLRSNPDLLHAPRLRKLLAGQEEGWEDNLVQVDEVPALREAQGRWKDEKEKEKEAEESSSSRRKKKKKSKKKKEKKKEGEKTSRIGGRTVAQKPLSSVFGGTGMDPDFRVRKKLLKKVRRKLKRSKETSSSGSSGTSSSTAEEEIDSSLLQDRSKIQRLSQVAPGVLAADSIKAMKKFVMTNAGQPWEMDVQSLPPIACQYARQFLIAKASPPMAREIVTLSHILDMMSLGRIAESMDLATQRLKSLELSLSGQPWQTAQKVELVANLEAQLATRGEVEVAQREWRLDQKSRSSPGGSSAWDKGKGKGKTPGKEREKGGKDRGKGGGKQDPKKNA